jgi:hypothetical protein
VTMRWSSEAVIWGLANLCVMDIRPQMQLLQLHTKMGLLSHISYAAQFLTWGKVTYNAYLYMQSLCNCLRICFVFI